MLHPIGPLYQCGILCKLQEFLHKSLPFSLLVPHGSKLIYLIFAVINTPFNSSLFFLYFHSLCYISHCLLPTFPFIQSLYSFLHLKPYHSITLSLGSFFQILTEAHSSALSSTAYFTFSKFSWHHKVHPFVLSRTVAHEFCTVAPATSHSLLIVLLLFTSSQPFLHLSTSLTLHITKMLLPVPSTVFASSSSKLFLFPHLLP